MKIVLNLARKCLPRKTRLRSLIGIMASALGFFLSTQAQAADDDGAYGRYDGDLDLRLGAGASFAQEGPNLSAFASALLLSSAGLYVNYNDGLESSRRVPRSVGAGFVIEPMFLARTAFNLEIGSGRLDLLIDSFAIGLGAYWTIPRLPTNPSNDPGLEFSLGFSVPFLPRASGPMLGIRGALRASPAAMARNERFGLLEQGAYLSITLGWRQLVTSHLVDVHDRLVR